MRKFALLTFALSILTCGIESVAQRKETVKALLGISSLKIYDAVNYTPPHVEFKMPGATEQWVKPGHEPYSSVIPVREDSVSLLSRCIKSINAPRISPAELLKRRQEALLQKTKAKLKQVYRQQCAEMEKGTALRDTLAWVRLANKAAELGLDSIALNCLDRFLSYVPSPPKLATAVDSLMGSCRLYVRPMIEIYTDNKFTKYWINTDSTKIGKADFDILAELGKKYVCYNTDLARGMQHYLDGDYDGASDLFIRAADYALESPLSTEEGRFMLFRVTAFCMSLAERYADMLTLFEESEALDRHAANDSYTAFLLYRASLFTDPGKGLKYADMGMAADETYFMEQFQKLYNEIYAYFIENPHSLSDLDFLFGGLEASQLSQSYIDMACKLIEKLPDFDAPYDGREHFYDEALTPYRDALLEIADRSDSLHKGVLTPDNALVKIIAESTSGSFSSSAEQGKANVKILYEQLKDERNDPEYYVAVVLSGFCHSVGLSFQKPKEALKVMNKVVLPTMEKLDEGFNPFRGEETVEIYKYMASLYRRTNKLKKAEKMQKQADEYVIVVE